jgi:Golgi apparatus protein 1
MTHDVRFDDAAKNFCAKDLKILEECNEHTDERGTGRLVSCLYDQLANITEPNCRSFITKLQSVIFTDWRLSEYFADACFDDITKLKCGRLDDENGSVCSN